MTYFINAIIEIINAYQNKNGNFTNITTNQVNAGAFGKYTIISDGRFKIYVKNSHIRFIRNEATKATVDFDKWDDAANQLILLEVLYSL